MQDNKVLVSAFSQRANGRVREIISDVGVSVPYFKQLDPKSTPPEIIKLKGLWDTGATNSVITSSVVQQLQIKPINVVEVTHAGGKNFQNVHLVNFYLPNNVNIPGITVTEAPLIGGNFDIIIGMDIIGVSDMAITNKNNRTLFSFQIPSISEIDFVQYGQNYSKEHEPIHIIKKQERNDLCSCGSGKKYKNCHGK